MTDIMKQINGAAMRGNPMMTTVRKYMNVLKASRNPQAALEGMMANNPQLQQVKQIVDKSGGDPMKAFRDMAEQNGLDPDEILSMITG